MKKIILLVTLSFIFILTGCTTNYFLCETSEPVKLYSSPYTNSTYIEVPVGGNVIATGKYKKYRKVKYGDVSGYVYKTRFLWEKKIRSLSNLKFDHKTNTYQYSSSNYTNRPTSTGGTVHVKGYYRKDGTYVKPHTRRAPSRRR